MKRLQRVRLINWHRFSDETIPFDQCVLLSGENGAGKSTILDAIQFVITCSKANFNKAAHEKGKRNLNSYIRCKTGQEDHPYERTGSLSAHICLEFYDEAKKYPFLLGVVMDTATEEKEPNTAWYLMEKQSLRDDLFFRGRMVKGIQAFRSTNKGIKAFCTTLNESKKMILSRFGRLDEKFFTLIPKALAFKPIHDIKDFVYSYVLDAKEVNIDALRENVHSYQELEGMLRDVKRRIGELEKICAKEDEVENYIRLDRNHEYFIARAQQDIYQSIIEESTKEIRLTRLKEEETKKQYAEKLHIREMKEEMILSLEVELQNNEEYRAMAELEKEKAALEVQLRADADEVKIIRSEARKALKNARQIIEIQEIDKTMFEDQIEALSNLENLTSLAELTILMDQVIAYKKQLLRELQQRIVKAELNQQGIEEKLSKVRADIKELDAKRLIYPNEVTLLRTSIRDQFARMNRSGDVRILCETLEITNPAWQNAVEGYLNTQRFYLIVDPDDFDLALSAYDRLREQKKVYGAGLINTGKLEAYDEAPKGSLAEVVTSKNIWARRYINMVLGRVQRCNSYQELKKHKIAITRQCMRYQNHVASAIPPHIYETPYIGAEAVARQLEKAKAEEAKLVTQLNTCKAEKKLCLQREGLMDESADHEIRYRLPRLEEERLHRARHARCLEDIKELKKNQTLIQKQFHLTQLKQEKMELDGELSGLSKTQGRLEEHIVQAENRIEETQVELDGQMKLVQALSEKMWEHYEECDQEYLKLTRGVDLRRFKENRERAQKANLTMKQKAEEEMVRAMREYKVAHDFGAADSLAGFPDFKAEYDKLKDSQLIEYEEKVYRARAAAEEEFKEQFLSRLQENIKQARTEFRELNRALSELHFSKERYEFLYEPKNSMKQYYTMIMDDFNLAGGESLFSGIFMQTHKQVIDELFEKLTLDDEDSAKTLEFFTDYRSYMDYDIKITLPDDNYMLYSKVSQEKSGGETQTPFYITVAASFIQLYKNSIGGDAIGLIMMDEAFNNMDDDRMSGVLEFLTNSNLQVVIAAPPDKIQYIGPYMDKILLALQAGKYSFIEPYEKI